MKKDAEGSVQYNGFNRSIPSGEVGKDVWLVPDTRGFNGGVL